MAAAIAFDSCSDSTLYMATTPTLSQIRARNMSSRPAIRPRSHTAHARVAALEVISVLFVVYFLLRNYI